MAVFAVFLNIYSFICKPILCEAEEADVLNVAMFGMTAKQWHEANLLSFEGGILPT